MSSYATMHPYPDVTPWIRRVHIRRDESGRWFWYHPRCKAAEAQIATHSQALGSALEHSCASHAKRYGPHIGVEPDQGALWASWLCPGCKEYCPSDNPCDCCMLDAMGDDGG